MSDAKQRASKLNESEPTPPKLQVLFQVIIYVPGQVNVSLLSHEIIISKASEVNVSHFSGGVTIPFSSEVNIYFSNQVKISFPREVIISTPYNS